MLPFILLGLWIVIFAALAIVPLLPTVDAPAEPLAQPNQTKKVVTLPQRQQQPAA